MKKLYLLLSAVIIAGVIIFVYVNIGENQSERAQSEEISEDDNKKETVKVISNTDLLNKMPEYEEKGKACKDLDDNIERGDCFQKLNSFYLMWTLNKSKDNFYFPYQHDQSHWNDVFSFTIDANDNLGELQKTEFYDDYEEETAKAQHGEEMLEGYWYVFSSIIPQEYRTSLKKLYWTDTGDDLVLAVGRDEDNVQDMIFMLSDNIDQYVARVKSLLLHEFGHILSLNEEQVTFDEVTLSKGGEALEEAKSECPTVYTNYGCVNEGSYLSHYYELFWADIMDEFNQIDWEAKEEYKDFFLGHEDHFFNSYQGTSPTEDIAEAFAFYVMLNSNEIKGEEEIKYKKLKFFYEYDELVDLRAAILENIYDLSVKDGEFY
ncbi:MAG TPA: hypothetical protein VK105_17935 [Virgibacillus sp.]|nr:hypothetical protein [Virgibacillus sp.]HLR68969.1 hypothetical protein [Virgibacillus sp.]